MLYTILAGVLALIALLVLLLGLRLLFGRHWFLGWLRGMMAFGLLGLGAFAVLIALDLYSYQELAAEEPVANLAFTELEPRHYRVSVVQPDGSESQFELRGEMWQLDARMLKWNEALARLGFGPGYRLDRLSGRYMALEDEKHAPRSVHALDDSELPVDTWAWLQRYGGGSLVDARYGSATYLPMADGALFSVSLGNTGLVARPLNQRAEAALSGWR